MNNTTTSFPERLILARKRKNFSQGDLAAELGSKSGKQMISNWELGKVVPNLTMLIKIAEILGTSVGYLANNEVYEVQDFEVPPGYMLLKTDEVVAMQRELLGYRDKFGPILDK